MSDYNKYFIELHFMPGTEFPLIHEFGHVSQILINMILCSLNVRKLA